MWHSLNHQPVVLYCKFPLSKFPSFHQPPSSIALLLELTFPLSTSSAPSLHPPFPLRPHSCVPRKCCQMRRGSVAHAWTRRMNRPIVSPRPALTPWDKPASMVLCYTLTDQSQTKDKYISDWWVVDVCLSLSDRAILSRPLWLIW